MTAREFAAQLRKAADDLEERFAAEKAADTPFVLVDAGLVVHPAGIRLHGRIEGPGAAYDLGLEPRSQLEG